MPLKLQVRGGLMRCDRCGKRYSSPFTHVCAARLGTRRAAKGSRVAPKASAALVKCGACGQSYANPLTHVCPSKRGDFKQRKAAAAKRQKAERRKARPQHDYGTCRDRNCQRTACEAFREGREEGFEDGYEDGYADGVDAGRRADR